MVLVVSDPVGTDHVAPVLEVPVTSADVSVTVPVLTDPVSDGTEPPLEVSLP